MFYVPKAITYIGLPAPFYPTFVIFIVLSILQFFPCFSDIISPKPLCDMCVRYGLWPVGLLGKGTGIHLLGTGR